MIPKNSVIKCKDDDTLYRVIESNGDRLVISPIEWDYEIIPQETIRVSDVETVILDSGMFQLAQNKMKGRIP